MPEYKQCVVDAVLNGELWIMDELSHFQSHNARRMLLTPYALLEQMPQDWPEKRIYLGLQIRSDADGVCIAYQEMEAFIRALAIEHNVRIWVTPLLDMTDNPAKWPEGISFLKARDFPICSKDWQPADHFKDPKNRLRGIISGYAAYAGQLSPRLEETHAAFCGHTKYQSELVKDYLAGLDAEFSHPSVAILYFLKVLERIGKTEYGAAKNGFLTKTNVESLMAGLPLTNEEKCEASQILRWRHNKSEAHLVTEGAPTPHERQTCKKVARLVLERALS